MKTRLLSLLLFCSVFQILPAQLFDWVLAGGGAGNDESYCVTIDTSGGAVITGIFSLVADIGGSPVNSSFGYDGYLAEFSPSGNGNWVTSLGGNANEGGHQVVADGSGNIYLTGEFEDTLILGSDTLTGAGGSDIFLARYNNMGVVQWAIAGGGAGSDASSSISSDASGNIYLTGHFENTFTFGGLGVTSAGGKDMYIARVTSSGNVTWLTRGGGLADDESKGIATGIAGTSVISGHMDSSATFGSFNLLNPGGSKNIFVAEVNSSGQFQWATQAGGNGSDDSYEVAMDGAENAYVGGYFHDTATFGGFTLISKGNDDAFIAKVNPAGNFVWVVQEGDTSGDRVYGISSDVNGNVVATGSFEETVSFGGATLVSSGSKDVFIAAYDSSGNIQWALQGGGPGFDRGYGIVNDDPGNIYVAGIFEDTASFGGTILNGSGLRDLFLAKIELPVGIRKQEPGANQFRVYPVPAGDVLQVMNNSGFNEEGTFSLLDLAGKEVYSLRFQSETFTAVLSGLESGMYIYMIEYLNRVECGKIAKGR